MKRRVCSLLVTAVLAFAEAPVRLPIPDRLQEPDAPDAGWCGEASIQMGLGYYQKDVSQKAIHAAGKSAHPDLHSNEIDEALETLGLDYVPYLSRSGDVSNYITWVKAQLAQGHPVFSGVKLYPTAHPEWSLDHFVLVVGYDDKGLYLNTNHRNVGQTLVTCAQLSSTTNRYAFENAYHEYFGRALTGLAPAPVEAGKTQPAMEAAERWLDLVDRLDFAGSWKASAATFQQAVTEPRWESLLQEVRTPLGALVSRRVRKVFWTPGLPDRPGEVCVLVRYEGSYAKQARVGYTVAVTRQGDGSWKVADCFY